MAIDKTTVQRVAALAQIGMTDQELDQFSHELQSIFGVIDTINTVDTKGILPLYSSINDTQRLREDVISEKNERDALQAVAPKTLSGLYLVPKVIE